MNWYKNDHSQSKFECYNSLGNRFDSLSNIYSQDDFIYTNGKFPYERIEIYEDNSVKMFFKENDILKTRNGMVTYKNDFSYFYNTELKSKELIFKGLMVDNQLRIHGYGYIYYTITKNGILSLESEDKNVTVGIPDIENLIKGFSLSPLDNSGTLP